VKLAHQEFELASLLKKLTLGASELTILRERAEKLRDGKLKMRGDALLPITLASFIFDSLCVSQGMDYIFCVSYFAIILQTCSSTSRANDPFWAAQQKIAYLC